MKTKNNYIIKMALCLAIIIVVLVTSSCVTQIPKNTQLYSGSLGAVASYTSGEAGRHWVRPQEFTYKPLDIVDYEIKVFLSDNSIQEAVIFGYPEIGMKASPFVIQAISEVIIDSKADGFLLSTYKIKRVDTYNEDTAIVSIHGRPLKLINLGEVNQERADKERFITNTVVEEDRVRGVTKTVTTTTPVALKGSQSFTTLSSDAMKVESSSINATDKGNTSTIKKVLLWTGGIVGTGLVIGALSSAASM